MIKKSFGASLLTTSSTLYEVPASKKAQWVLLYAVNTSGNTATFSVDYYDASTAATLAILKTKSLSSKEFFEIGGGANEFIALKAGDKVNAYCNSNNAVTLLISVIEDNDIIQGG